MPEIPIKAFLVSVVVLREGIDGVEVLLLKRNGSLAGTWCQVAGKIEAAETAWQAALRELEEETGLVPDRLYSADICEQFYEAGRDAITIAPVFVAYVGSDAEIRLNAEHSAFRWLDFAEAAELVSFGGQRRVLRWIKDEFIDRAPSDFLRINTTLEG